MRKLVLKICAALLCSSALVSQAFAEDLASTGSYGNYLKQGCFWASLGKSYQPMSSTGQQVGTVIIDPLGLICPPNSSGTGAGLQAQKVYVTVDYNPGYGMDYTQCHFSPQGTATAVGTGCDNYKVSRP